MDYFKNFQLIKYDFTTNEEFKQLFTLSDISTRVQSFYEDSTAELLFDDYMIKEWDTPEKLSYNLYGTTDYYWTILYVNNIFDMFNDWPLTGTEIDKYAKQLYSGKSPSPLEKIKVEIEYYEQGVSDIVVVMHPISSMVETHPEKIIVGTFVDAAIAGDNVTVEGITNIYYSDNPSVVEKIILHISSPTRTWPNIDINSNLTFNEFSPEIEEYLGIAYYMNSGGVIKDLNAARPAVVVDGNIVTPAETIFGVTKYDDLMIQNERKRRIKVVKPERIVNFSSLYFSRLI